MNCEQRAGFSRQSIESHDPQIEELVDRQAEAAAAIRELAEQGKQTDLWLRDRLSTAMTGLADYAADHERRIGRLERRDA